VLSQLTQPFFACPNCPSCPNHFRKLFVPTDPTTGQPFFFSWDTLFHYGNFLLSQLSQPYMHKRDKCMRMRTGGREFVFGVWLAWADHDDSGHPHNPASSRYASHKKRTGLAATEC
jgi:hypothetical protein